MLIMPDYTRIDTLDLLHKYLHIRYKPKKANFRDCVPCPIFHLFDWVIWIPDALYSCRAITLAPKTVLCLAHPISIRILEKLRFCINGSILVIAGEDTNLSTVLPSVEKLLPSCKKVYYEAKDIEHPAITSFSMGFNSFYLRRVPLEHITNLIRLVSNSSYQKRGVLAAWGEFFPQLDKRLRDRRDAKNFIDHCSWIQREKLMPIDYWKRLAESRFLLAPAGNGIQSPKLAEAWLMRTIPIVTRNPCFVDLHNAGFPMLILPQWKDLTPKSLEDYLAQNPVINWDKVQSMLTLDYFNSKYLLSSNNLVF